MADRGIISSNLEDSIVTRIEADASGRGLWHHLESDAEHVGKILARVDRQFRNLMSELHTAGHVANAIVYQMFDGALVAGVQMAADETIRIDFDLPYVDNDQLRGLVDPINEALRCDFPIQQIFVPASQVHVEPGLVRSKSVTPPPQKDGSMRIIDIVGLDRQACGGTHLTSTGQSRPLRILKIDNKGRHNRRIRFGFGAV
jgi:misacylated tRNA(Ala) deacylase